MQDSFRESLAYFSLSSKRRSLKAQRKRLQRKLLRKTQKLQIRKMKTIIALILMFPMRTVQIQLDERVANLVD